MHFPAVMYNLNPYPTTQTQDLGDEGGSGSGLVLECRRELLLLDVVSSQSVNSGFNENHSAKKYISITFEGHR